MLKTFLYLAAGLLLAWCSWFVPIYLVGLLLGDFLVAIHLFALAIHLSHCRSRRLTDSIHSRLEGSRRASGNLYSWSQ
jgi:hypothetical protein